MKEENVAALATLLKTTPELLSVSLNEGDVSEFIDKFQSGHKVMTVGDFETFQKNLKDQHITEMATGKVPKVIYDKVYGTALEMKEKELAEKFGVTDFKGLDGLVEKIVESKAKNPEDISKLKQQIELLTEAHKTEVEGLRKQNDQRFINLEVGKIVDGIEIDAEGAKLENQKKILSTMLNSEFEFQVKGDTVVAVRNGDMVVDSKLDPIPLNDVIRNFAKDYVNVKSPEGGRGDGSSHSSSVRSVNLQEYMVKNGIKPNSVELSKAVEDFKQKGIEIIQ